MYTSHQIACLFRCRPWPGTLQHNGSSSVYSHLSSSNWVFLSLLVFHFVICSYFHPLLSRSLSTFFFNLVVTFAIFQRAETEKTPPPQSLSPLPLPPSNRSPLSSLCISLEIWQVTGPFHPSMLFFSPPLSPIPSLSHTVHR